MRKFWCKLLDKRKVNEYNIVGKFLTNMLYVAVCVRVKLASEITMTNNQMSRNQLVELLNELNGILMVNSIGELMSYLQEQDISPPRFMALQILELHPGITITTLAHQLKLTLGSASQLIDRLENDGLVIRQEVPNDRRVRRIFLLEKGKNILNAVHSMTNVKLDQQLSAVPNEQIQSLYTAITNVLPYLIKDVKWQTPAPQ